jgi:hypothetical protein
MKKYFYFLITSLMLHASNSKAQVTLDTVITPYFGLGYNFFPTQISPTETKYVYCDTITNTFSLYNMDFTPFLSNIAVPQPFNLFSFQVMYITRSLFDCDSTNIEYAYGGTNTPYLPYYIMRTDGTQLLQVDSAFGPYCLGGCQGMSDYTRPIRNTSDGAKLFLYKQVQPAQIYIYSLCGELPTDVFDLAPTSEMFVKIFPNPASQTLTFQINPPDNINEYQLVILDNNAKEVGRQKINYSTNEYTIDVHNFSSGTYIYSLCTKNRAFQSGKFIVTK